MSIGDWIVLGIIVLIVGGAVAYIVRAKKKGKKCIGCPDAKICGGSCASCACDCQKKNQEK